MLKRIKNPIFLLALSSLVFKIVAQYFKIDYSDYQVLVDSITYLFIGSGIYSTFDKTNK